MAVREIRTFLSALAAQAHEIRAPWVAAEMLSSALEQRLHALQSEDLTESKVRELREMAARLRQTCRRGATLMDTSVALANPMRKIAAGEPVHLAQVATEAASLFECISGKTVPVTVFGDQARVIADRQTLVLGVVYLLRRAIGASWRDDIPEKSAEVELVVDHTGRHSVLSVIRRLGADPEQAPTVHNATHADIEKAANGHAVAFCKRAVEAFGGTIEVRDVAGEGATVSLKIPDALAPSW